MIEPDTYFLSKEEALKTATKRNKNDDLARYKVQLCYYAGEKIESELDNLVHLDLDNLVNGLGLGTYRMPTHLNVDGLDLSKEIIQEINDNFFASIEYAKEIRSELNKVYAGKFREQKLNFSEKLRVYLLASESTRVMQYVSKDIANFFEKKGFSVMFDLLHGIEDASCLKKVYEFNPHITININHFNNSALNDDIFNFVWFQDQMPVTVDKTKINLRDRDYIFVYQSNTRQNLIKKGVSDKIIFTQDVFPVETDKFYLDESIKKENKIVFVGTHYKNPYAHYIDGPIDEKLKAMLRDGKSLTIKNLETIFTTFLTSLPDANRFINYLQQMYIRNMCVEWLCDNKKEVEIYGYHWDESDNKNIIDKFHGVLTKDELNKVYNSAKYVLSASGQVLNTQRLGEIVHCGAIPVVYDSREITDESQTWDDECLYFKTQEELNYILDNNIEPKKYRSKKMLEHFTYEKFYKTINSLIQKKTNT